MPMLPSSLMERVTCPSCGGAGGGPVGRAGSAWDVEDYVCPRCEGEGVILMVSSQRPGLAKKELIEVADKTAKSA